jgi:hypothetical protein
MLPTTFGTCVIENFSLAYSCLGFEPTFHSYSYSTNEILCIFVSFVKISILIWNREKNKEKKNGVGKGSLNNHKIKIFHIWSPGFKKKFFVVSLGKIC